MAILVTGAAGFIGSHLCEELMAENRKLVALDNFDPYYSSEIKENNVKKIVNDSQSNLVREDIRNTKKVRRVFEKHNIQKVVHLAARGGVRSSVENPSIYEEINVGGTINLLDLAAEYEVENFIYGSSSSVYGDIDEVPFREDGPTNPISPYAASKLSAEIFCKTYSQLHDLNTTILRFFTVYGPRQRPMMAIHKFTRLIEEGKEIPMYGDGTSKRDYTYIDDIVSGIMSALEKNYDFEVFNLGKNETVELKRLVTIIEEKLGKEARIDRQPMPKGDVPVTFADISKAKDFLDYEPRTSIWEGIGKFVEWYRKNSHPER